jgi:hypothetical protein
MPNGVAQRARDETILCRDETIFRLDAIGLKRGPFTSLIIDQPGKHGGGFR